MPLYVPPPPPEATAIVSSVRSPRLGRTIWSGQHGRNRVQWALRFKRANQAREAAARRRLEEREAGIEKLDARNLAAKELAEMTALSQWTRERVADLAKPPALKPTAVSVYGDLVAFEPQPARPEPLLIRISYHLPDDPAPSGCQGGVTPGFTSARAGRIRSISAEAVGTREEATATVEKPIAAKLARNSD
jgi:hypothetical protein